MYKMISKAGLYTMVLFGLSTAGVQAANTDLSRTIVDNKSCAFLNRLHTPARNSYYIYPPTVNGVETYDGNYFKFAYKLSDYLQNIGLQEVMSNGEANLHIHWQVNTEYEDSYDFEQPPFIKKGYGSLTGLTNYNERISGDVNWNRGHGQIVGTLGYGSPFTGYINYNDHGDGSFDLNFEDGMFVSGAVNFVTRDMISGHDVMELVGYDQYDIRYQMRLEVPLNSVVSNSKCKTVVQVDFYEGSVYNQRKVHSSLRRLDGCDLDTQVPRMMRDIVRSIDED